jgi:hypothetical protein
MPDAISWMGGTGEPGLHEGGPHAARCAPTRRALLRIPRASIISRVGKGRGNGKPEIQSHPPFGVNDNQHASDAPATAVAGSRSLPAMMHSPGAA